MRDFIIPRGELKRRIEQINSIDENVDVEVVTLQQWLYEHALEHIYDITDFNQIQNIIKQRHPSIKEFIDVNDEKITIGLNVEKVDNNVINDALSLLTSVDNLHINKKHEFGQPINTSNLVESIHHI